MAIPLITHIASIPLWGLVFGRFNLALTRISVNIFFLIGLFMYFQTKDITLLCFASALVGLASGGGIIGLPTPFLAYWILSTLGPAQVSWASSVVITASFLIFLKLASNKRLHPYHS